MNKDYYQYPPPDVRKMKYIKLPWDIPMDIQTCIERTFTYMHKDNNLKELYNLNQSKWLPRDMSKPAIKLYSYYLMYPEEFNHETDNIIAHMMQASKRTLISFSKQHGKYDDQYYKLPNKLVDVFKDQWLSSMYQLSKDISKQHLTK